MAECDCCDTEICVVCYTGINWDVQWPNYTQAEGRFYHYSSTGNNGRRPIYPDRPHDLKVGRIGYAQNTNAYRFFDATLNRSPSSPDDSHHKCGNLSSDFLNHYGSGIVSNIRPKAGCGPFNDAFGNADNCTGQGFPSNIYSHPFSRLLLQGTGNWINILQFDNRLLAPNDYKYASFSISTASGYDARVEFGGAITFGLGNFQSRDWMLGGGYDTSVTGNQATAPYRHVFGNELYSINHIHTYRAYDYSPGNTGLDPWLGRLERPWCEPALLTNSFVLGGENLQNPPPPAPRSNIRYGVKYVRELEGPLDLYGLFRINPVTLATGTFVKTYDSNVDFDRFGDTSSDASGGKSINQSAGWFLDPDGTSGSYPVTEYDGFDTQFANFARGAGGFLPDDPFLGTGILRRRWSLHPFTPFVDVEIYSKGDLQLYAPGPSGYNNFPGDIWSPDFGFGNVAGGVDTMTELGEYRPVYRYTNHGNPRSEIKQPGYVFVNPNGANVKNSPYYNDIPLYIRQRARFPRSGFAGPGFPIDTGVNLEFDKLLGGKTSDVFAGYKVEINIFCSGDLPAYTGVSWHGDNVLGDDPSGTGLFQNLKVVTCVPQFGFCHTGYIPEFEVMRCMYGEAQTLAYSNHKHHDVIEDSFTMLPSGTYPGPTGSMNAAANSVIAHKDAYLSILDSHGLTVAGQTTEGGDKIDAANFVNYQPLSDSTHTNPYEFFGPHQRLKPLLYGQPSDEAKQDGTFWSYTKGNDWATAVDNFVPSDYHTDYYGELAKSKGVAASIGNFGIAGDDFTAGLVHKTATWYFRNSAGTVTGTQNLSAMGDYQNFTIPPNVIWEITGGAVSEHDRLDLELENIGIATGYVTGVTLYPASGSLLLLQTGVVENVVPSSVDINPYESRIFNCDAKDGLSQNFPFLAGYLQSDITFRHSASGFLIDDPHKFSVKVLGTGGITPPGP